MPGMVFAGERISLRPSGPASQLGGVAPQASAPPAPAAAPLDHNNATTTAYARSRRHTLTPVPAPLGRQHDVKWRPGRVKSPPVRVTTD